MITLITRLARRIRIINGRLGLTGYIYIENEKTDIKKSLRGLIFFILQREYKLLCLNVL